MGLALEGESLSIVGSDLLHREVDNINLTYKLGAGQLERYVVIILVREGKSTFRSTNVLFFG